jgi:hypothetical protein
VGGDCDGDYDGDSEAAAAPAFNPVRREAVDPLTRLSSSVVSSSAMVAVVAGAVLSRLVLALELSDSQPQPHARADQA